MKLHELVALTEKRKHRRHKKGTLGWHIVKGKR